MGSKIVSTDLALKVAPRHKRGKDDDDEMTLGDVIHNFRRPRLQRSRLGRRKEVSEGILIRSHGKTYIGSEVGYKDAARDLPSILKRVVSNEDLELKIPSPKRKRKRKELKEILEGPPPTYGQLDRLQPMEAEKPKPYAKKGRAKARDDGSLAFKSVPLQNFVEGMHRRKGGFFSPSHCKSSDMLEMTDILRSFSAPGERRGQLPKRARKLELLLSPTFTTVGDAAEQQSEVPLRISVGRTAVTMLSNSELTPPSSSDTHGNYTPASTAGFHTCEDPKVCRNACVAKALTPNLDHMSEEELIYWYEEVMGTKFVRRIGEKVRGRIRRVIRAEAKRTFLVSSSPRTHPVSCKPLVERMPPPLNLVVELEVPGNPAHETSGSKDGEVSISAEGTATLPTNEERSGGISSDSANVPKVPMCIVNMESNFNSTSSEDLALKPGYESPHSSGVTEAAIPKKGDCLHRQVNDYGFMVFEKPDVVDAGSVGVRELSVYHPEEVKSSVSGLEAQANMDIPIDSCPSHKTKLSVENCLGEVDVPCKEDCGRREFNDQEAVVEHFKLVDSVSTEARGAAVDVSEVKSNVSGVETVANTESRTDSCSSRKRKLSVKNCDTEDSFSNKEDCRHCHILVDDEGAAYVVEHSDEVAKVSTQFKAGPVDDSEMKDTVSGVGAGANMENRNDGYPSPKRKISFGIAGTEVVITCSHDSTHRQFTNDGVSIVKGLEIVDSVTSEFGAAGVDYSNVESFVSGEEFRAKMKGPNFDYPSPRTKLLVENCNIRCAISEKVHCGHPQFTDDAVVGEDCEMVDDVSTEVTAAAVDDSEAKIFSDVEAGANMARSNVDCPSPRTSLSLEYSVRKSAIPGKEDSRQGQFTNDGAVVAEDSDIVANVSAEVQASSVNQSEMKSTVSRVEAGANVERTKDSCPSPKGRPSVENCDIEGNITAVEDCGHRQFTDDGVIVAEDCEVVDNASTEVQDSAANNSEEKSIGSGIEVEENVGILDDNSPSPKAKLRTGNSGEEVAFPNNEGSGNLQLTDDAVVVEAPKMLENMPTEVEAPAIDRSEIDIIVGGVDAVAIMETPNDNCASSYSRSSVNSRIEVAIPLAEGITHREVTDDGLVVEDCRLVDDSSTGCKSVREHDSEAGANIDNPKDTCSSDKREICTIIGNVGRVLNQDEVPVLLSHKARDSNEFTSGSMVFDKSVHLSHGCDSRVHIDVAYSRNTTCRKREGYRLMSEESQIVPSSDCSPSAEESRDKFLSSAGVESRREAVFLNSLENEAMRPAATALRAYVRESSSTTVEGGSNSVDVCPVISALSASTEFQKGNGSSEVNRSVTQEAAGTFVELKTCEDTMSVDCSPDVASPAVKHNAGQVLSGTDLGRFEFHVGNKDSEGSLVEEVSMCDREVVAGSSGESEGDILKLSTSESHESAGCWSVREWSEETTQVSKTSGIRKPVEAAIVHESQTSAVSSKQLDIVESGAEGRLVCNSVEEAPRPFRESLDKLDRECPTARIDYSDRQPAHLVGDKCSKTASASILSDSSADDFFVREAPKDAGGSEEFYCSKDSASVYRGEFVDVASLKESSSKESVSKDETSVTNTGHACFPVIENLVYDIGVCDSESMLGFETSQDNREDRVLSLEEYIAGHHAVEDISAGTVPYGIRGDLEDVTALLIGEDASPPEFGDAIKRIPDGITSRLTKDSFDAQGAGDDKPANVITQEITMALEVHVLNADDDIQKKEDVVSRQIDVASEQSTVSRQSITEGSRCHECLLEDVCEDISDEEPEDLTSQPTEYTVQEEPDLAGKDVEDVESPTMGDVVQEVNDITAGESEELATQPVEDSILDKCDVAAEDLQEFDNRLLVVGGKVSDGAGEESEELATQLVEDSIKEVFDVATDELKDFGTQPMEVIVGVHYGPVGGSEELANLPLCDLSAQEQEKIQIQPLLNSAQAICNAFVGEQDQLMTEVEVCVQRPGDVAMEVSDLLTSQQPGVSQESRVVLLEVPDTSAERITDGTFCHQAHGSRKDLADLSPLRTVESVSGERSEEFCLHQNKGCTVDDRFGGVVVTESTEVRRHMRAPKDTVANGAVEDSASQLIEETVARIQIEHRIGELAFQQLIERSDNIQGSPVQDQNASSKPVSESLAVPLCVNLSGQEHSLSPSTCANCSGSDIRESNIHNIGVDVDADFPGILSQPIIHTSEREYSWDKLQKFMEFECPTEEIREKTTSRVGCPAEQSSSTVRFSLTEVECERLDNLDELLGEWQDEGEILEQTQMPDAEEDRKCLRKRKMSPTENEPERGKRMALDGTLPISKTDMKLSLQSKGTDGSSTGCKNDLTTPSKFKEEKNAESKPVCFVECHKESDSPGSTSTDLLSRKLELGEKFRRLRAKERQSVLFQNISPDALGPSCSFPHSGRPDGVHPPRLGVRDRRNLALQKAFDQMNIHKSKLAALDPALDGQQTSSDCLDSTPSNLKASVESVATINPLACEQLGEGGTPQDFEQPSKLPIRRKTISPECQLELMHASSYSPQQKITPIRLKVTGPARPHSGFSLLSYLKEGSVAGKNEGCNGNVVSLDSSDEDTDEIFGIAKDGSSGSEECVPKFSLQLSPSSPSPAESLNKGDEYVQRFSLTLSPTSPSPESVSNDSNQNVSSQEAGVSPSSSAPSSKGILKTAPQACKGPCKCKECSLFRSQAGTASDFIASQMKNFEKIAGWLTKDMQELRALLEAGHSSPAVESKIQETLKKSRVTEQNADKNLALLLHDCKRYCKLTARKPVHRRKIVFADEAGKNLCHVRTFRSRTNPRPLWDLL